jgi:hypothetical protein
MKTPDVFRTLCEGTQATTYLLVQLTLPRVRSRTKTRQSKRVRASLQVPLLRPVPIGAWRRATVSWTSLVKPWVVVHCSKSSMQSDGPLELLCVD